ncbi:DUF6427 family protein [Flagellimonas aequoris]|uniref:Beta-carotene 15,15'-monooxygenase n=1 Tax=Flagellimonas aequoris TaxID=2306997 RepID=A0A418NAQ6_9FLAO|nr:DUF6427 family protein [Allomuricauda aequoris]RIV72548.1 hypothetical protein D2U88_04750 [Allomuricauda aequoris]TXK05049.1 hypothetical protein FQ019_04720 [Allomuricauda aequoris]
MISSFFGKTKPIVHFVLGILLLLFYFSRIFFIAGEKSFFEEFPWELLAFGVLLLVIFIIHQIVRTEKLTDFNSYAMLFFALLAIAFSEEFEQKNAIFTNLFLLLALWRLLSIKSVKNVKHKIFDASLLIALASLFYDWALVFLVLIFVVINMYDRKTFKNWLVPLLGVATIFVLTFTTLKVLGSLDFFERHYQFTLSFLEAYSFLQVLNVKALVYFILVLIIAILVFLRMRSVGGGKLLHLRILFLALVFGILITLFTPVDESPVLITFFPASVFLANYFEAIKRPKLQEVVLILCLLLSFLLFALELNR